VISCQIQWCEMDLRGRESGRLRVVVDVAFREPDSWCCFGGLSRKHLRSESTGEGVVVRFCSVQDGGELNERQRKGEREGQGGKQGSCLWMNKIK